MLLDFLIISSHTNGVSREPWFFFLIEAKWALLGMSTPCNTHKNTHAKFRMAGADVLLYRERTEDPGAQQSP
jgi:hypothetical protein